MTTVRHAFSDVIRFKAEPGLNRAVAARLSRTSSAEWMRRRALRERLEADGITLQPIDMPARRDAA